MVREGDLTLAGALARSGFLDGPALLDRQAKRVRAVNRIDAVLSLMDWRHGRGSLAASPRTGPEPLLPGLAPEPRP